jgi:hypothetical protein
MSEKELADGGTAAPPAVTTLLLEMVRYRRPW